MRHILAFLLVVGCLAPVAVTAGAEPDQGFRTRAVWVTRWAFKDSADVKALFAELDSVGVNTVFFQVRGSCDALYRSSVEPWSSLLSGRLGVDPGWDPLDVALREGRSRGIQVHAWINLFTGWAVSDSGTPPPSSEPLHVLRAHPDWVASDREGRRMPLTKAEAGDNYAFLSPTHVDVQAHISQVVRDLVGRYDLDGLHLDYVRFPDSSYSYDADSRAAFRLDVMLGGVGEKTPTYSEWRMKHLTDFVGRLAGIAREERPGIQVSATVWQKMEDAREIYLQDGVGWMLRGHLDFLVPMIYTPSVEAFEDRLATYVDAVGAENVVAGLGPYLEAFTDSVLATELDTARAEGVRGYSVFNSDFALKYGDVLKQYGRK
jgi:uncharacterized lipoprotein YddW (UPF0748 family)